MGVKSWKNISVRNRLLNTSSIIFIFFIILYLTQAIFSMIYGGFFAPYWDLFGATSIISVVFVVHLIKRLNSTVPFFIGMGFIPHVLGLYKIMGDGGTLYGWPYLNYHYDWIVHSFAMFCYSIAFCSMIYPHLKKGLNSKLLMYALIVMIMLGFGAFNEIMEYVGFDVLGFGEGFLEFGDGDSSPYQGPWQNSSMDMVSNLFGALIGTGLFLSAKQIREFIG